MGTGIQLKVHVSSRDGRIDVMQCLRDSFAGQDTDEAISGQKSWVYVSGPAGLLDQAEDACVDLEKEMKRARSSNKTTGRSIINMEHYIAKWEV